MMTPTSTNEWIYNGQPVDNPPSNCYGFVYLIENTLDGRRYIGKKFFWAIKQKQVNKKKKRYKAESDWKTYWSSSDDLKADVDRLGPANFTRTILYMCPSKGMCNYLEAKEQFTRGVLEQPELWYNSWIQVKVHKAHVKPLE